MDTAIQTLDRQITGSKDPRVDEPFRESWRSYTTRWQIQRDSWLSAGSVVRKFGFSESTYEQFKSAFQKWQTDFQKRIIGASASPPAAPAPEPKKSIFGDLFAGSGTAILIAGLIVGGFILYTNRKRS